jgi:hypothetical protein
MKKVFLGLSLALVLVFATVLPAMAEEVTKVGVINSIDGVGGTFTMTTAEAEVLVVTPPAGFDFTSIAVGDTVSVSGDSDGAGNLAATSVAAEATEATVGGTVESIDYETCTLTVLTAEGDTVTVLLPEGSDCSAIQVGDAVSFTGTFNEDGTFSVGAGEGEEEEKVNTGFYCSNPDVQHPALGKLAVKYEADYGGLLDTFCGQGVGVGGVAHALNASQQYGVSAEEILAMRETMGWGQIWKALREAAAGDNDAAAVNAENDDSGPGNGKGNGGGNGGGKPPWAGGGGGNGNGNGNGKGPKK